MTTIGQRRVDAVTPFGASSEPSKTLSTMSQLETIQNDLQEIKRLTLLNAKQALTVDDVCTITGLSKSYVYKLVCEKKIPYYKSPGGKITYFRKSEIENWLLSYRVATADEAEQSAISYCVTKDKKGNKK